MDEWADWIPDWIREMNSDMFQPAASVCIATYIGLCVFKGHTASQQGPSFWRSFWDQSKQAVYTFMIFVWCCIWVSLRNNDALIEALPYFETVLQFGGMWEISLFLSTSFGYPIFETFAWRRMFRWRRLTIPNYLLGHAITWLFIYLDERGNWGYHFMLTLLQFFLFRNAALYGQAHAYLFYWYVLKRMYGIPREVETPILMLTFLRLVGGMAESSNKSRAVILLCEFVTITVRVVNHQQYFAPVMYVFCLAHGLNCYARCVRPVRDWSKAVSFLRLSELRVRRAASKEFRLKRRQDMDLDVYGDPASAQHIVAISHAWLSPGDADPEGYHLDLLIERLEQRLCPYEDCIRAWWWRWYVYEAEADVLIFFDMASLDQAPRTPQEDKCFRMALNLMPYLYGYFEVLVITDIPSSVKLEGRDVPYIDKGWCWAEANQAKLQDKLRLSPGIMDNLKEERSRRKIFEEESNLCDTLWGFPRYTTEVLEGGMREILTFRDQQQMKGKVFTSGKTDLVRVSNQLRKFEDTKRLRTAIESGVADDVAGLLAVTDTPELANVVFDCEFTTPLHLAIQLGFDGIVEVLLASGAKPCRNFFGDLPWELVGLPRFSKAARAALSHRSRHERNSEIVPRISYVSEDSVRRASKWRQMSVASGRLMEIEVV